MADWAQMVDRVAPILVFLVAISVIAELADRLGLFTALGHVMTRLSRGRVWAMWLLLAILSLLTTATLSLDTTAVLVTPIALAMVKHYRLPATLLAWTTLWTANCASLLLPVANLTNLLVLSQPDGQFAGMGESAIFPWWQQMWAPALWCAVVPLVVLGLRHRRVLAQRVERVDRVDEERHPPGLTITAAVICASVALGIVAGLPIVTVSVLGALAITVVCLFFRREAMGLAVVPWRSVLGVSVLFVVVTWAHGLGLADLLVRLTGTGDGVVEALRLGAVSAAAGNVINNLPAYLALEPVADSGLRTTALLLGVNAGPLVTPWASVATLLWAGRCRAAGIPVPWRAIACWGAGLAIVLVGGGCLISAFLQ